MRTLSSAVQTLLASKLGLEPVNILEVQWAVDGPWLKYADKDITNYEIPIDGKILEISTLESVVKLDSQGQTQNIAVRLSDAQGDLKDIFDNHDLQGKFCKLYQWFDGLPLSERFKIYEGEISSPIIWDEGDRTLAFEVMTKLSDKEIGFSPEEGYFEFLPHDTVGVAWPLVFGTVQNVPATLLSEIPNSVIAESLSAVDPSLYERAADLSKQYSDLESLYFYYVTALGVAEFTCDFGETEAERQQGCSLAQTLQSNVNAIAFQMAQIQTERDSIAYQIQYQREIQNQTLSVLHGELFPQGVQVTVQVNNIIMHGQFTGNIFDISDIEYEDYHGYDPLVPEPFGHTWIREGTTIRIQSDAPIIYIVNLMESTVLNVQAWKETENGPQISVVPTIYYEIKTENVGPYTVTYIALEKPLSSYDETFSDQDLFVSQTSPIGPNVIDILIWLIETYTDLDYDTTSFNTVMTEIDNYPAHFALLERKDIITTLEEIAFQSRCSLWISDRTFYIKYLAKEQTEVDTLTEADIDAGSMSISTTNLEDIVTKLVATWREDYAYESRNKIILRHNVKKYGTREREIDFYIYNIQELVLKSATFWLIRFANTWKYLNFTTYIDKIALETFDTVKFDFNTTFIANTDVKGTLTSAVYDSNEKTINMQAWLPVKTGTMEVYDFAEPSQISIELWFPTNTEISEGYAGSDGIGAEVEGGLELTSAFRESLYGYASRSDREATGQRIQNRDWGDQVPSDLDDVKPYPQIVTLNADVSNDPNLYYLYPLYDLTLSSGQPPVEAEYEEKSFCYPGIVNAYRKDDLIGVNLYTQGLSNPPSPVFVKQLQLHEDAVIPTGTWVIVAYNKWDEEVTTTDPETGEETTQTVEQEEWTMQVPIWL